MTQHQSGLTKALIPSAVVIAGLLGSGPVPAADEPAIRAVTVEHLPILGPYSQAVIANGFLFASGVIAMDPDTGKLAPADIVSQTRQVFENIKAVLKAGGTSLANVVKVSVFLRNPADFAKMNEIYAAYFPGRKPARTTVPGVRWSSDQVLIEIEVTAVIDTPPPSAP